MVGMHATSGRGRLMTVVLVAAAMIIAFGGGLGAAKVFNSGNNSGGGNNASGPTVTASPCVTTTSVAGAGLPKPTSVQLNVYNAAHVSGLARRTGTALAADGFVVLTKANDPLAKTLADVGEIRYGPAGAKAATLLLAYVRGARLVNDGRSDATVDFAVGEAFVTLATPAQVLSALAAPVTVKSGNCAS